MAEGIEGQSGRGLAARASRSLWSRTRWWETGRGRGWRREEIGASGSIQLKRYVPRRIRPACNIQGQQKAAGAALSAKRGEAKGRNLQGAPKDLYDTMSEEEQEELAFTPHKGLPEHKD
jgi:hypothetical protein